MFGAHKVPAEQPASFPLFVYDLSPKKARGRLSATLPAGWTVGFSDEVEVAPGERREVRLRLSPCGTSGPAEASLKITDDFGPAGQPAPSLRLLKK
ncbi:MAG TPA: hypothetical protein VNT26_17340 [Candidatus Sulfotelmatobacter sp.]|nr:hypothetical protein [Candidatus Sulfotelmatobacter sp.]